jgi:NAD kinase
MILQVSVKFTSLVLCEYLAYFAVKLAGKTAKVTKEDADCANSSHVLNEAAIWRSSNPLSLCER